MSGSRGTAPPAVPSVLLPLRGRAAGAVEPPFAGCFWLDGRVWTLRVDGGPPPRIAPGESADADVTVRTDPWTLTALIEDPAALDGALADGRADVTGDADALRRLLATAARAGCRGATRHTG
ncbi:SCP-2 sterol transfer family protein [Prauserella shujinwangii]|uniref:SCP-2 sterol transfer family protein n=1 Tax=Prauserella shujinwangii TaxID=1453103 RepID=A0A2T0LSU0_9PSEU|nr:SCP2 sterol-binding domain-containing protein [Prauserella shujinwangii]PRX46737.1 SCP-2 sterol transfer family protein [Prauserella shujinwangii]